MRRKNKFKKDWMEFVQMRNTLSEMKKLTEINISFFLIWWRKDQWSWGHSNRNYPKIKHREKKGINK